MFRKENLKQFEMEQFTDTLNSDVYQLTKMLYAEQLIQLSDHPVLVPEILTLEAEKRAKNKVIVRAPNRRGAHDDISDAFVRAVYICYTQQRDRPYNIATGTGGIVGSVNRLSASGVQGVETAASFYFKRQKMHGDNSRNSAMSKRRMAGSVRIPAAMFRRITTGI
jgi:hypothetical protein